MKTVRFGTFETNSSSTHAICMCTEEDYRKFKNMELFWVRERLQTPEEIYAQFTQPYQGDPSTWETWAKESFEKCLCNKLPTYETFLSALKDTHGWEYVRESDRHKFGSDDDWILANIKSWLSSHNVGNTENYSHKYNDYYYETFFDSFNGTVAFGYFGHD